MDVNVVSLFVLFYFCACYVSGNIKSNDVRNYLGTRTPYRLRSNKDDTKVKFTDCKDYKVWMMIRHGTRLPSAKDISGMNSTLSQLKYEILLAHKQKKGILSEEQLKSLQKWTSSLVEEEEKFLTKEGQDEMVLLAERMQKRFPNAIKQKYSDGNFLFRYTATQRAQQSARYFALGLFDKKDSQDVIYHPATNVDTVLRFYKHCDRWIRQVKKNPKTYEEQRAYGSSLEMNSTLETMSRRLGLDRVLTLGEVNLMYKICGFESSWEKHYLSPWCYGFDVEDAERLEYYHDLKHYWQDGYGHNFTYRHACMSIKHMFETFRNESSPNATFLFAHSGTLLKVLAHVQLYKPEEHLRGVTLQRDRPWKSSLIDCFGSNLAFVLFRCNKTLHVLTLHQEKIVKLPMCDSELCPLDHLLEYFHESIYNCDYTDMCRLSDNKIENS